MNEEPVGGPENHEGESRGNERNRAEPDRSQRRPENRIESFRPNEAKSKTSTQTSDGYSNATKESTETDIESNDLPKTQARENQESVTSLDPTPARPVIVATSASATTLPSTSHKQHQATSTDICPSTAKNNDSTTTTHTHASFMSQDSATYKIYTDRSEKDYEPEQQVHLSTPNDHPHEKLSSKSIKKKSHSDTKEQVDPGPSQKDSDLQNPLQSALIVKSISEKGYRLGPRVGRGSYAKVKLAERISDSQILAAKIVSRRRAAKEFLEKFLPRELGVLLSLNHPNIITVYEVIHTVDTIYIIMEYANKGDLLDFVKQRGTLREDESGTFFAQICDGVNYLHERNICHRDLKCENVLLRRDYSVALTDFGFSRTLPSKDTLSSTYCGSAAYASPELLRGRPYNPLLNDIWSMGCVLFIMVTGHMPFSDKNQKKMLYRQLKGKVYYPDSRNISQQCKHIIGTMLEPNTTRRFTTTDLLEHEWLKSFHRQLLQDRKALGTMEDGVRIPFDAQPPRIKSILDYLGPPRISVSGKESQIVQRASLPNASPSTGLQKSHAGVNFSVSENESSHLASSNAADANLDKVSKDEHLESLERIPGKECILHEPLSVSERRESSTSGASEISQDSSHSNAIFSSASECNLQYADDSKDDKSTKGKERLQPSTKKTDANTDFTETIRKILQIPFRSPILPSQQYTGNSHGRVLTGSLPEEEPETSTAHSLTPGDAPRHSSPGPSMRYKGTEQSAGKKSNGNCSRCSPAFSGKGPSNLSSYVAVEERRPLMKKTPPDTNTHRPSGVASPNKMNANKNPALSARYSQTDRKEGMNPPSSSKGIPRPRSLPPPDKPFIYSQGQTRIQEEGLVMQIKRIFESKDASTATSSPRNSHAQTRQ